MYINPFWAGVLMTLFLELLGLFILAMISAGGRE